MEKLASVKKIQRRISNIDAESVGGTVGRTIILVDGEIKVSIWDVITGSLTDLCKHLSVNLSHDFPLPFRLTMIPGRATVRCSLWKVHMGIL